MTTKIAIYNRSELARTGYNSPLSSMGQLLDAVKTKPSVLGVAGYNAWTFASYYHALGGELLDPSNTHARGFLNSSASLNVVRQLQEWLEQGFIKSKNLHDQGDLWGGLLSGELLMIDEGPWFYSTLASSQSAKENILRTTIPAPFPGNFIVGGENLVITKGSLHVELLGLSSSG